MNPPDWLDASNQKFLGYALVAAGEVDKKGKKWIEFERLADPKVHNRTVAAQAFLHVLSLATKNAVSVKQDGALEAVAFGTIHIGVPSVEA